MFSDCVAFMLLVANVDAFNELTLRHVIVYVDILGDFLGALLWQRPVVLLHDR